jgi:hypothetical protein
MTVNDKAETAKYVRDEVVALSHIANGARLDGLTHLLDMAALEANRILAEASEGRILQKARL